MWEILSWDVIYRYSYGPKLPNSLPVVNRSTCCTAAGAVVASATGVAFPIRCFPVVIRRRSAAAEVERRLPLRALGIPLAERRRAPPLRERDAERPEREPPLYFGCGTPAADDDWKASDGEGHACGGSNDGACCRAAGRSIHDRKGVW